MVDKYLPASKSNYVFRDHPNGERFQKLYKATTDDERASVHELPYMSIVGALLYVAVMSRPDIAYHTSLLAKFMSDPTLECYECAVALLLYVAHKPNTKITYDGSKFVPYIRGKDSEHSNPLDPYRDSIKRNGGFMAYSDSSWGNDVPYPMFGFCVYLFGGIVSFASKQLKVIAFSSCEAEYAACSFCCREIEFIRFICADMGFTLNGKLCLIVDNSAAIDVANNMGVTARTKHFKMAVHYFRDLVQHNSIVPIHCFTYYQRADGFTKGLSKAKHIEWTNALYNFKLAAIYKGVLN